MSRSQRDSRPPSNYPRRYPDPRDPRDPRDLRDQRDMRDPRDYEDRREKMERIYDEKVYERTDRYIPQSVNSQPQPGYHYDLRRTQSSNFMDRFTRTKKYPEQPEREPAYRPPPETQSKRDRSPMEYISEVDKISDIIKKEYQFNPPLELNIAPTFSEPKPWD